VQSPAGPVRESQRPVNRLVQRLHDSAWIAGRLAHDFDNILMGVMGFAELAQAHLAVGSTPAQYLNELLRVAQSALTSTRQMHQFSRAALPSDEPASLEEAWRVDASDRAAELAVDVGIEAHFAPDLPAVAVAIDPLRVILRQLVHNAAESMPGGGNVTVTGRAVECDEARPEVLPTGLPLGRYVELTVADAGPGFPAEVLARVAHEPFQTTKARRRGLGLATVLRILHTHGGGLSIESTPRGAAVRVYLPLADAPPPAPGPSPESAARLEASHP
jgi:two-component system cell cycle sensor histidine kinase/response regulator CckA